MIKNLFLFSLVIIMQLMLCTCDETIIRPDCSDRNDISLVLFADYFTDCKPADIFPAGGTSFRIISGTDTIISGNMGANGRFETGPIDSTGCGLNNVVIEASFKGKSIREEFGLLCCDTTLSYHFSNISCNQVVPVECKSIDTTITRDITSSGDCILQNAPFDELKNNSVIISSQNPLKIKLDQLLTLKGKISVANIVPAISGNEIILNGNQLEIYFDVDRSEVDTIGPVTIQLPAFCLDSLGKEQNSGTITILIKAMVCDPNNCYCPFNENASAEIFYAKENVPLGEDKSFNFMIYSLSEGVFSTGCQLKIDSIKRADGSDAYLRGTNSWIIEQQQLPSLKVGDDFSLKTNFAPTRTGEITEEFIAYSSVYSESDLNTRKNQTNCSFRFKLRGDGCEMNCPVIQVLGKNVMLVNKNNQKEIQIAIGKEISFSEDTIISQHLNAKMTTNCLQKLEEPAVAAFTISSDKGFYCSNISLSIQKNKLGAYDDQSQFTPVLSNNEISNDVRNSALAIYFDPPNLADYYNSNHGNNYQCDFILTVTDIDGNIICTQEIQESVEVFEFSLTMGDVIPMQAFSQISAADKNPSYHVYDVDEYNATLGNYGLRESLTPAFVNFITTPNTPLSSHTLYFDVDSPKDTVVNFNQMPKLFLINTPGNNFSMISSVPVTTYSTPNEFFSNYENGNLMNTIFSGQSIDPDAFSFSPNRSKDQFAQLGGISIQPSEVYVIWDPSAIPDKFIVNNNAKRINCGMALIYISSVKSGDDNTDPVTGGNGKASVSFYVVYPVKY